MLDSTKKRLRTHSRTLALTVGVAGGVYLAASYAVERLRDLQLKAAEERQARESLRRRFVQNQEDCTFTLLALLPTLSAQVLAELDVEQLTHELQQLSRANPSLRIPAAEKVDLGESVVSLAASSAGSEGSSGREGGGGGAAAAAVAGPPSGSAAPATTTPGTDDDEDSSSASDGDKARRLEALKNSSHESWSEEFRKREELSASAATMQGSTQSLQSETSGYLVSEPSEPASSPEQIQHAELPGSPSLAPAHPSAAAAAIAVHSPPETLLPAQPPSETATKTKMQLWNELKLLTFTRSLTTVYTLVLLTLQTRVQLNLLGRYSYIRSVRQLDEVFHPSAAAGAGGASESWWGYLTGVLSSGPADDAPRPGGLEDAIDQETEMAYLTCSWWLMNVGWRDVKERVALAVDDVFGPVSLKKVIDRTDLETLLAEVRRKVEWDLGGDGIPRRHSFLPHLLPSTPALETHLLVSSTLSPAHPPPSIPAGSPLRALLDETASALASPDFTGALDASLACAFGALAEHLALKGVLGGEVLPSLAAAEQGAGLEPRGKGRRLAEVLVEVSKWGRDCLVADQGGLGRNDIIDSLADLPALGAFSATVYSAYDDLLENDFF